MKLFIITFSLLFLITCQSKESKNKTEKETFTFYVGTYTSNESKGIYKYTLDSAGNLDSIELVAETENPSFLTIDHSNRFLIAVNEVEDGSVESFALTNGKLKPLSKSFSGGANPCYISVDKRGYILVANYSGGNVGLLKLNENGHLSELLDVQDHNKDSIARKQSIAHAHSSRFNPENGDIVSADLGTNELIFSTLDTLSNKFNSHEINKLKMPIGSGPRHFDFHPNQRWIYVVNELNNTVTHISKDPNGNYVLAESISTLPENYKDTSYCADIHLSNDGLFLYASNRGHNSIVIFKIDQNNGSLQQIEHIQTKGNWPRNFVFSPNESFLLVANQHSNNIVAFKRDKATGLLSYASEINAPAPVCLLFKQP